MPLCKSRRASSGKGRQRLRSRATLLAAVTAALAGAALQGTAAAAPYDESPTAAQERQSKAVRGFYKGRSVRYLDLGPVKLARGNEVAPIWVFMNGAKGQRNIIDVAPGDRGYTPLWRVVMATWRPGAKRTVLRSAAQVRAAARSGRLRLERTATIVNCPVLGFGQETTPGFYRGGDTRYLDLGPIKLSRGNKVAPLWAVTNGTDEQRNVIDVVPGDRGYTPLWRVSMVTWRDGVTPRTLRSAAEIRAAEAAGEVTVTETQTVVNCPVV